MSVYGEGTCERCGATFQIQSSTQKWCCECRPADKRCPRCDKTKPIDDFNRSRSSADGASATCRACSKIASKEWRQRTGGVAENPRSARAAPSRSQMRRHQEGRCAICGVEFSEDTGTHLDHDHACCPGGVKPCVYCARSLLCMHCNLGLGSFGDDPDRLARAANYITRWSEVHAARRTLENDLLGDL